MKVYLESRDKTIYAEGVYDEDSRKVLVKKGAKVSGKIKRSETFAKKSDYIKQLREKKTKDGVLVEDLEFDSLSGAACFLMGTSCNGLLRWKNKEGITLNKLVESRRGKRTS